MAEKKSEARPNQTLPKGHFNPDGTSQGKQTGAVRPSPDAQQGPRKGGQRS